MEKFVEFDKWCSKCKYEKTAEAEDPCHDCLNNSVNDDSHKPVYFEEK